MRRRGGRLGAAARSIARAAAEGRKRGVSLRCVARERFVAGRKAIGGRRLRAFARHSPLRCGGRERADGLRSARLAINAAAQIELAATVWRRRRAGGLILQLLARVLVCAAQKAKKRFSLFAFVGARL